MSQDYADAVAAARDTNIELSILDLAAEIAKIGTRRTREVRVFRHTWVPLTRTNAESGEAEEVLFWKIDGDIYVRPERWDAFEAMLRASGVRMQ